MTHAAKVLRLERLAELTAGWTGFALESFQLASIDRAARALSARGISVDQMIEGLSVGDPALLEAFGAAVSVGETYFFRHPEQFELVVDELLPARLAAGRRTFRAWSAGCATGEEAYSLAACLTARTPVASGMEIEVVGSDLLRRNIRAATAGRYGPWSIRTSALPYPVFEGPPEDGAVRVLERLRRITMFRAENLLDPPGEAVGDFDVIFCRNVLAYLSPEANARMCARLTAAAAPDGALVFATLDLPALPPGWARIGRPELNAFTRADHAGARPSRLPPPARPRRPSVAPPSRGHGHGAPPARPVSTAPPPGSGVRERGPAPPATPRRRSTVPPPVPARQDALSAAVALHREALELVERGDRERADALLTKLGAAAPEYLPGIFEHALLHARAGRRILAAEAMRELLRKTEGLAPASVLHGVSDLPVDYYRIAARAFLDPGRAKKRS